MQKHFRWSSSSLGWVLAILGGLFATDIPATDWLQWRGPTSDNHAQQDWTLPLRWNVQTGQNIQWKTAIDGRGHSTPIFVGDWIYLTTHDPSADVQALVRLDRNTGRILNKWAIHRNVGPIQMHSNNSGASPSPASDGQHVYVSFHNRNAIHVTAVTLQGRQVWQRRVCDFAPQAFEFGYGASPIIEGELLIVAAEFDGDDSGIYALDLDTGKPVWKIERPINLNFASAIVAPIAGERLLVIAGAETMDAYDPVTGQRRWSVPTTTEAICGTIVWDDRRLLISGGNPTPGTWCINAAGEHRELWSNRVMCYEQSLLANNGYVYAVADSGVAYCWRTHDGREMWKERLFGGGISASPLLVGDELLVASERGEVYVLAANPDRFEMRAQNQTGESIFASPVAVDDTLYIRSGIQEDGKRQEYLIAISEKP
ncbi:outer membrane protein assembly factor BamB family protein [Crateriforma conspicua]|uniref:Outer membrane biogenesis protein BamB n=1 Tax=Crateriforma conspicua TaxID=2527996 RepID=A0A5C5YD29_9PLAN|nr:PQQ-binding-like beta-propeller repeat protein [Crateriforma conspicua]TWT72361.1 outer membrane biogenesis protein BamB [Crateriforma conspicua]